MHLCFRVRKILNPSSELLLLVLKFSFDCLFVDFCEACLRSCLASGVWCDDGYKQHSSQKKEASDSKVSVNAFTQSYVDSQRCFSVQVNNTEISADEYSMQIHRRTIF